MKKRDIEKRLKALGYWQDGGSKHDKWTNNETTIMVPRHTEINEYTAKGILREAEQFSRKGKK